MGFALTVVGFPGSADPSVTDDDAGRQHGVLGGTLEKAITRDPGIDPRGKNCSRGESWRTPGLRRLCLRKVGTGLATPVRLCAGAPEAWGRMCVERLRLARCGRGRHALVPTTHRVARRLTLCFRLGVNSSAGLRDPAALGSRRVQVGSMPLLPLGSAVYGHIFLITNTTKYGHFPASALFLSTNITLSKASCVAKPKTNERQ